MMDADVKTRWVTALRSGQYEQTCGTLRTAVNEFCCLGVLCDLTASGDWAFSNQLSEWFHTGCDTMPSDRVLDDAYLTYDQAETLAAKNDCGWTFREIADHIEREL